ncbi:glucose PTS transporter subunit EIIB [Actinomyces oris]|nr:PTS glucose/sucrose transporter subunit IIB [Actinomyces oris]OLO74736.1 PTS sugar transporter [Actinomyces oris]
MREGGNREGEAMSTASDIVAGLGGQENITDLEPCITRLRVEVADQTKVDEEALRAAGAFGVVRSGRVVQVVVGPTADSLASEISAL